MLDSVSQDASPLPDRCHFFDGCPQELFRESLTCGLSRRGRNWHRASGGARQCQYDLIPLEAERAIRDASEGLNFDVGPAVNLDNRSNSGPPTYDKCQVLLRGLR